ncbi:hypothetical protein P5673_016903 [Acropora cervicornis]|uniref:Uncharacterized protein n=1 Tax=Acropora cervicornis TaxID=6130 RepID=A0AAD9V4M1_ACRCE|nr:hypothetical protein P5673_016903 [Acropora cervicornis]
MHEKNIIDFCLSWCSFVQFENKIRYSQGEKKFCSLSSLLSTDSMVHKKQISAIVHNSSWRLQNDARIKHEDYMVNQISHDIYGDSRWSRDKVKPNKSFITV